MKNADELLSAEAEYEQTLFRGEEGPPPEEAPPSPRLPVPTAILSLYVWETAHRSNDFLARFLISGDIGPIEETIPLDDCTTMQAYVIALAAAIAHIPNGCNLTLLCDLEYITKGVKFWCRSWAKNKWRKADGDPVKYAEVWQEIYTHVCTLAKIEYDTLPEGSPLRNPL